MGDTVLTPPAATKPAADTVSQDRWTAGFLKMEPGALRRAAAGPRPPTRPRSAAMSRGTAATAQAAVVAVVGPAVLSGLPDGDAASQIREIVTQHAKLVPTELAVFRGFEYLDDLARISNPDERAAKLKQIGGVLAAVSKRREALRAALKQFPAPQPEAATKSIAAGWTCFQDIAGHLPDEFQRMDGATAERRVATMMMSNAEKADAVDEARGGFKDGQGVDVSADMGKSFKGVVEPVSTKGFERQNFYFDQFVASPPQEQIKQLIAITDTVVAQGQLILDAGGKLKDVEALMAKTGIPKDWWPPQFVDTLQAWRKTERAMMQERVSDSFQQKEDEGVDIKSVTGFVDFFCNTVPEQAEGLSKVMGEPEVVKAVSDLMGSLKDGYGLGGLALTALQTLKFDELPQTEAKELSERIENGMKLVASAVDTAVSALHVATSVGASIMANVVPGLSIVSCGIKLGIAIKKLAEHAALRVRTGMMKDAAVEALGNASMEDGGGFLNTLSNEVDGRNKQIGKDGIEVFAAGADLAGSAAGSFGGHYGIVAQGALKVTSTAVTLGAKFVFTNIDWAAANKAKALMAEARAGNPVARMEIFKDSNHYAKMYICVLCKEGSPLAREFVIQRGIEEQDLDGAMSMKLLRNALLESADQKDENDIEENWLLENTGALGKAVVGAGKAIGGAATAIDDKLRKERDIPYDPAWAPKADIQLTEADWKEVKAAAIKAGLYDEATGIGTALGQTEKHLARSDAALAAMAKTPGQKLAPSTKQGEAVQKLLTEALAALDGAYSAASRSSPMSNPAGDPAKREVHKGMALYLGKLLEVIGARRTALETALRGSGLKKVDWTPDGNSDLLDAAVWDINWASGVKNACLPKDDMGLGKALAAAASAKAGYDKAEAVKQRDARLVCSDALNDVVAAGKACLSQAGEVPAMAEYVQKVVARAAADRRALDETLGAVGWGPAIPKAGSSIMPADWQKLWDEGVKLGHVSAKAGDGGVLKAITEMVRLEVAVDAAADGKPKLKARLDFASAAGAILLAKDAFLTAQRDVANPLKQCIENIYTRAVAIQKGYQDARATVAFTVAPGLVAVAAWKATYKDAVEKGALPEAKGATSAFTKAVEKYLASKGELDKAVGGKKYAEALKLGVATEATVEAAIAVIDDELMVAEGYARNAVMAGYLQQQRTAIKALLVDPVLEGARSGNAAGAAFFAAPFTFVVADFDKAKASAIKLGVIMEQKTGMQAALGKRGKTADALAKAKAARPPVPGTVKQATDAALAAAQTLRSTVARLKTLSKNAKWAEYVETAVVAANTYQKSLA